MDKRLTSERISSPGLPCDVRRYCRL